jgi:type II secretory pathway predicted ATPase ExeA
MYSRFFGFSEKPFNVTPDPRFLFLTQGHREMLAALLYGIKERRGFIAIVGEVGTGKTTLINTVLSRLDEKTKVAYIFNTAVTYDQLLTMALAELGLAKSDDSLKKIEAVNRLNKFAIRQLTDGHNVVLIVDEAQNLDLHSMENLRLLSNLETRKHKLIQIVLSGQPELDAKLSQPELRQLAQRISLKRYIIPLSEKETYEYIQHRLRVADYKGPPLFSRRAQKVIWEYSRGVPRKINILCDNALLIGYAGGEQRVKATVVEEAVNDLTWSPFSEDVRTRELTPEEEGLHQIKDKPSRYRLAWAVGLVIVACVLLLIGLYRGNFLSKLQKDISPLFHHLIRSEITSQPSNSDQPRYPLKPGGEEHNIKLQEIQPMRVEVETDESEKKPTDDEVYLYPEETGGSLEAQVKGFQMNVENAPTPAQVPDFSKAVRERETRLTSVPEIKVEPEIRLVVKQVYGHLESKEVPMEANMETNKENLHQVKKEKRSNQMAIAPTGQERVMFAKKGDYLSKMILRVYGKYDKDILDYILRKNPEIVDKDLILVGQPIQLPTLPNNS